MFVPFRKIYIAGHTGLIGSALVRRCSELNSVQLILASHSELDLTHQKAVQDFVAYHRPDVMIIAAGKVGGIAANSKYPAEFIYQNLMMEANLIHGAWKAGVKKLLNFGSACIYPKNASQPMPPDLLMSGKLEETNEPYAIAKLAGLSLCQSYNRQYGTSYINVIPSNVYGPGDSYDLERCHVISATIAKFHQAKINGEKRIEFWGSGNGVRDFLYVDDLARACLLLLETYKGISPINVGAMAPCVVRDLMGKIKDIVGFEGEVFWDSTKPDGALTRILDATVIKKLGFVPQVNLETGLRKTVEWYQNRRSA